MGVGGGGVVPPGAVKLRVDGKVIKEDELIFAGVPRNRGVALTFFGDSLCVIVLPGLHDVPQQLADACVLTPNAHMGKN